MGNIIYGTPYMMIDRIIAAEPYRITVGICGSMKNKSNPYKEQVISINDGPLKSLLAFTETNNSIKYDFEDDISLQLIRRNEDIIYHLKTPEIDYNNKIHQLFRGRWNKISLLSDEIDKIGEFIGNKE